MATRCKIRYVGKVPDDVTKDGTGIYTLADANGDPCSFDPSGGYSEKHLMLSDEQVAAIEAGQLPFVMVAKNVDSQGRPQKIEMPLTHDRLN